jgi:sortase A
MDSSVLLGCPIAFCLDVKAVTEIEKASRAYGTRFSREERAMIWEFPRPAPQKSRLQHIETGRAKRERKLWTWTERALLASGLALLAVYGAARIEGVLSFHAALRKFAAIKSHAVVARQTNAADMRAAADGDTPEMDSLRAQQVASDQEQFPQQSDVPSAVLRISKIHLEAPVFNGTDDLTLNHGVGRILGTARPGEAGNIGIGGHRDGFFRGLKNVGIGDAIDLETPSGTDTYVVDQVQIVTPEDTGVLQPRSVPSLTLVTCYPFYFIGSAPKRYIVTASLIREIKGGAENSTPSPLIQTSSSQRRNNEQAE